MHLKKDHIPLQLPDLDKIRICVRVSNDIIITCMFFYSMVLAHDMRLTIPKKAPPSFISLMRTRSYTRVGSQEA